MTTVKQKLRGNEAIYNTVKKIRNNIQLFKWHLSKHPLPRNGKRYVHLGCGEINHPEMINIDLRPMKHIHFLTGVEKLRMFEDESVDLIYISHCLEHIPYRRIPAVLSEWKRVLRVGGILRISVPNFDDLLSIYYDKDKDLDAILPPLFGGQDYKYNFHYSIFNERNLKDVLLKASFTSVKIWSYGQDEFSSFADWSGRPINVDGKYYPVSLNMEVVK